jgi:hypothetical protein
MIENPEEIYSAVVYDGCCVESKGVSLCNLEDFMNTTVGIPRSKYQVWSDKHRYYKLFFTIDEAVEKFLELRG